MPKRKDLKRILVIGSGPIVIGQGCEFDYSGSQACKALKEEGYEVVLVNSNPATIMTDPKMADRTYIEPLNKEFVEKIIKKERPDALLPNLGGQTGLNLASFLAKEGILKRYGVECIGASAEAIAKGEDRKLFKETMLKIGLKVPESGIAYDVKSAMQIAERIGFPIITRPAFTLGGAGGATSYNMQEFEKFVESGLETSPVHQLLVERSVIGWKEIEFEVVRDCLDNAIIVTSMENIDPMGVHTGDSAVVAPAQTLTAKQLSELCSYSKRIIRAIGVNGGTNIQFAVSPFDGQVYVIEINPRLSRSSALASKATGFPIARVATKLAVGLTLDEVKNDVTGKTYTMFEPTVDYCVFKISRFTFEKFPNADPTLNTSMKAVGEAMSIGRNFKEAFQKGIRSLETKRFGFGADGRDIPQEKQNDVEEVKRLIRTPNAERFFYIRYGLKLGMSIDELYELSKIDKWFLQNMKELVEMEEKLSRHKVSSKEETPDIPKALLETSKEWGFSDVQIANITNSDEDSIYKKRKELEVKPVYKLVDTCGGEFDPEKPYFYSAYEKTDESRATAKKKVIVLGGGPNRIGQGIEFDYCCVHASYALKEMGYEAIMVNSNPETVSTDYDTSDRLYFEPLTREDVLNIVEKEKPEGVIIQFGGQTPLNLALSLEKAGVKIIGTSPRSIDIAEDRKLFKEMLEKLRLKQPPNGTATDFEQARAVAKEIGYPVLVRPSYVLGGRAMEIVYDDEELKSYMEKAIWASPERPVLIDKFLEDAIEIDVDAISDGKKTLICGIMEHIEEAGIHSGDSACSLPPYTIGAALIEKLKEETYAMASELKVCGLMNVQFAIKGDVIYVLEVNPRASRTVPFVAKATGVPWVNFATKAMLGHSLDELGVKEVVPKHVSVKEAVFPFVRFPGVDPVLGPEMKSTGEVMGIDNKFGIAFMKSQIAAGQNLPLKGNVFLSVKNKDKRNIVMIAKKLHDLKFGIYATRGTAEALEHNDIPVKAINKIGEGRPDIMDLIKNGEVSLLINTPSGKKPRQDEISIRAGAYAHFLPLITTISGAQAAVSGIEAAKHTGFEVKALQDYFPGSSSKTGKPSKRQ